MLFLPLSPISQERRRRRRVFLGLSLRGSVSTDRGLKGGRELKQQLGNNWQKEISSCGLRDTTTTTTFVTKARDTSEARTVPHQPFLLLSLCCIVVVVVVAVAELQRGRHSHSRRCHRRRRRSRCQSNNRKYSSCGRKNMLVTYYVVFAVSSEECSFFPRLSCILCW